MLNFSLNNIYFFSLVIIFSPLIGKLVRNSLDFYKLSKEYKQSTNPLDILNTLNTNEFQIWCGEYLSHLGYSNILINPIDKNISLDISSLICNKNNTTFYVLCIRTLDTPLSLNALEYTLGSLFSNSLSNAILITTSTLSKESAEFISTLPQGYTINLLSLNNTQLLRNFKQDLQCN